MAFCQRTLKKHQRRGFYILKMLNLGMLPFFIRGNVTFTLILKLCLYFTIHFWKKYKILSVLQSRNAEFRNLKCILDKTQNFTAFTDEMSKFFNSVNFGQWNIIFRGFKTIADAQKFSIYIKNHIFHIFYYTISLIFKII